jgi:glycosyltransferase involved in cell wall biosynthesis
LLNQTYDNLEIIVVDDCSTDSSLNKVKSFSDPRIQIIELKKNEGYSAAKNHGIIRSKGELICILDADDMLTKDSVSARVNEIEKSKSMFLHAIAISVYGDISLEDCYHIKISKLPMFSDKLHLKNKPSILRFSTPYHIHSQTTMVRRDVYNKFGLYDEGLKSRSDREMWWRFFGQKDGDKEHISRVFLDYPVVYYRYHDRSMTHKRNKDRNYDKEVRNLSEKAYNLRKTGITNENTRLEDL